MKHVTVKKSDSDHDLLIKLHEKVDQLMGGSVDYEGRLRKLESTGSIYKGAIAILIFLSGLAEPILLWMKKGH